MKAENRVYTENNSPSSMILPYSNKSVVQQSGCINLAIFKTQLQL